MKDLSNCVLIVKKSNLKKQVFHQIAKLEILTLKPPWEKQCVVASKSEDITSREMVETMC